MHPKKDWKNFLNSFIILLFFFSFSEKVNADFHLPLIKVPCGTTDCNLQYNMTNTHYKKADNSNDLLIYLPGGRGTRNLGYSEIFPQTHLSSLRGKIDLVFLASPYPMPHPKSNAPLRKSKDHFARIKTVIDFYKKKTGKRIWLSGCSLGTNSVGHFLSNPEHHSLIHGAIFMCTNYNVVFRSKTIDMPILLIHHNSDKCSSNPVSSSIKLGKKIKKINKNDTTVIRISGGEASGDPCSAQTSFHMFGSKAPEANDKILEYINSH